ncbi:MAG: antitoxin [Coriobacteriia bacterium]|nr:antitoxin [Coriobacteriia bacterium]
MPRDLLIRGVPDDVYASLKRRAVEAGRSLQAEALDAITARAKYSMEEFIELSKRWTSDPICPVTTLEQIVEDIRSGRESR